MNRGTKRKSGFGMLEVLLSGVIIITMLGALVFTARNIINNTTYSQQRAQAAFIAQDAIESVRQIRDSNYIDGVSLTKWDTFAGEYSTIVPAVSSPYCLRKLLHNPRKRYHLVGCTLPEINKVGSAMEEIDGTSFYRYVYFSKVGESLLSDPDIIGAFTDQDPNFAYIVKVEVEWIFLGKDKKIVVEELIANSRQAW